MDGGERLPDEEPQDDTKVRWAAGAFDGVGAYHGNWAGQSEKVETVFEALKASLARAEKGRVLALYNLLKAEGAIALVDPTLDRIRKGVKDKSMDAGRLWRLAHWIARQAPDREPVKFAMAILGMFTGPDHRRTLITLGRHDEFTLYAAVAIGNTFEDPEVSLWELAKGVDGWGRVHSVERLAKIASRPEIKQWLLVDGYKNSVMIEYLAASCAKGGGLVDALREEAPADSILAGAAEILDALVAGEGGPFESLRALPDGPEIVRRYLDHVKAHGKALEHYITAHALNQWAEEDDPSDEPEDAAVPAWPSEVRSAIRRACHEILEDPGWELRTREALKAEDRMLFAQADRAAKLMGIDTWPIHMDLLMQGKGESWWSVTCTKDPARMAQVVALAEDRLPLEELATGPDIKIWGGAMNQEFSALDFILQSLGAFPGLGWPLVRTGLQSPVIRARNMAVKTLKEWGRAQWPVEAPTLVQQALAIEPHPDTRQSMEDLMKVEPGQ